MISMVVIPLEFEIGEDGYHQVSRQPYPGKIRVAQARSDFEHAE
jgi:hypothetical protein